MLSIIICTKNRAADLAETLKAFRALPEISTPGAVEIILVDNGSTDQTASIAREAADLLSLRYVMEDRGGQSSARNAGLRAAQGDIIIFTDDDVRPASTWLEAVTVPIRSGQGDIVAGGIELAPHLKRPWMEARHLAMLAANTHEAPENIKLAIGANLAFHRRVLEKVPGFDVELGPGASGFCDDLLFNYQAQKAGFVLIPNLSPEATVVHHPDPARFTREAFASRLRREGESLAYIDHHWQYRDEPGAGALALKRRLRLLLRHVQDRGAEMPTWQTMNVMQDVAYYDRLRTLQGTVRNYDKHGLIKKHGILEDRNLAAPAKMATGALK